METHDKLDALLYGIADEADASVDYAAMLAAISKKVKAQRRRNLIIRLSSIAAAAVVMLSIGGMWLKMNMKSSADENMAPPEAPEAMVGYAMPQDSAAGEAARDTDGLDVAPAEAPAATGAPDGVCKGAAPIQENCAADENTAYGDADNGGITSAPASGSGEPTLSGVSANSALVWHEAGMELPGVTFGSIDSIESDENGFACTVSGCTDEDMQGYMASLEKLCGALPVNTGESGAYTLKLEGGVYVMLELDGDMLSIKAKR